MITTIIGDGLIRSGHVGSIAFGTFEQLTNKQIMDLMSAKKEVIEASRKEPGRAFYIDVDKDGECSVVNEFTKNQSAYAYKKGSEIALPEAFTTTAPTTNKRQKKKMGLTTSESAGVEEPQEKEVKTKKTSGDVKSNTKMSTAKKAKSKKAPAKKAAAKKSTAKANGATKVKGEAKVPRGNTMMLTAAQWKKVDAAIEKEGTNFSSFSRGLVLKAIKE